MGQYHLVQGTSREQYHLVYCCLVWTPDSCRRPAAAAAAAWWSSCAASVQSCCSSVAGEMSEQESSHDGQHSSLGTFGSFQLPASWSLITDHFSLQARFPQYCYLEASGTKTGYESYWRPFQLNENILDGISILCVTNSIVATRLEQMLQVQLTKTI